NAIRILASAKTTGPTGVEMEALTAASIAALTIYDMVKAVDKAAVIEGVKLLTKSGGKSGNFVAEPAKPATIMGEVSAPRADKQRETSREREAFRAFMTTNRLRATQWAKDAGVPVSEIYAYLTGKTRAMPSEVAERLARVARTRREDMFR